MIDVKDILKFRHNVEKNKQIEFLSRYYRSVT